MEERPQLTLAIIEGLKAKGLSQSDIARMFGVTPQAVSYHVRKYGGSMTPRQKALESWPFMVPDKLCHLSVYKNLRDHAEYWATNGEGMSFEKLSRLRGFYQRLENQVVEYVPDDLLGGFAYRQRLESDGDLLIRVNDYTHLSEEGRRIWVLPNVMPDPLMHSKV